MNYLAHLYLSKHSEHLMVGNFIADQVKGNPKGKVDDLFVPGIKMHRLIDEFTDNHSIVKQSKRRLHPQFHKLAGVITDIYFDHFLAANWKNYSQIPLIAFSESTYDVLSLYRHQMPELSAKILSYMSHQDWLTSYAEIKSIQSVFERISSRLTYPNNLNGATEELERNYKEYFDKFNSFFKELELKFSGFHP